MSLSLVTVLDKGKVRQLKSYAEAVMGGTGKLEVVSHATGHPSRLQQSDKDKKGSVAGVRVKAY